jgi:gamma-glutamyltranspeptidase/glutathione hydrolase
MIASQGESASLAARQVLLEGGNVFDAATVASFVLAVERPQSTGLGGGGFLLYHQARSGEVGAVDFREVAPRRAREAMFQDGQGAVVPNLSTEGALASGVPGMVAGVLEVQERFGRLPRARLLAPAIRLAEEGFPIYPHLAAAIRAQAAVLRRSTAASAIFLRPDGSPRELGERLAQPDLARTLRAIAESGRDGFYKGPVAQALVAEQRARGGLIDQEDLDGYRVKLRAPVRGTFRGFDLFSMPPPSSGGIHVIEILNLLEEQPAGGPAPGSAAEIHRIAAAMQLAFFDRSRFLGDPDQVRVPAAGLVDKRYARSLARTIPPARALRAGDLPASDPFAYESSETTHFTIADRDGNVVASTQTINGWLGSGLVVPGAGFLLNNQMDDFSAKPGAPNQFGVTGSQANAIAPGKRPLSSMSPTIVLRAGRPVLALGSPAGSQIITCVALTALHVLGEGAPLWDAVAALRFHHQWQPDLLLVEEPGFPPPVEAELRAYGYDLRRKQIGCKVEAVAIEHGRLHGVADPRGEGLAVGEGPPPALREPAGEVRRD